MDSDQTGRSHFVGFVMRQLIALNLTSMVLSYHYVSKTVQEMAKQCTVNFLNIRTPKTFVVITLKFELCGSTIE